VALYEYTCSKCGQSFERIMKRGARAPRCPECGGSTRQLVSAPAIHFRGTGWYVTDYARKGKNGGKESDSDTGRTKAADKAKAGDTPKASDKPKSDEKKSSGDKSTAKK
jgi:putative FmdB family regulatory protein